MLKQAITGHQPFLRMQPPSGGCVLKPSNEVARIDCNWQPPSGGCVLKLFGVYPSYFDYRSRLRAAVC